MERGSKLASTNFCSRVLPELARVVTKSRITAKVIWASLILRLTFHLIWVSMTARDVHGKWIHFFDSEQLIATCDNFWSGRHRKPKVPEKERRKGEGGCIVISQAAIGVS